MLSYQFECTVFYCCDVICFQFISFFSCELTVCLFYILLSFPSFPLLPSFLLAFLFYSHSTNKRTNTGVGVVFIGLQVLQYQGYINIDFLAVQQQIIETLDADGDGKFDTKDLKVSLIWVKGAISLYCRCLVSRGVVH